MEHETQKREDAAAVLNYPILEHFTFDHLPEGLQEISRPFCDLAFKMAKGLQRSAEVSAGLRKLLEAKDCMVRAAKSGGLPF